MQKIDGRTKTRYDVLVKQMMDPVRIHLKSLRFCNSYVRL